MLLYHWTPDEYENANALVCDWGLTIEGRKAEIADGQRTETL